jgi:hypothetical protein
VIDDVAKEFGDPPLDNRKWKLIVHCTLDVY